MPGGVLVRQTASLWEWERLSMYIPVLMKAMFADPLLAFMNRSGMMAVTCNTGRKNNDDGPRRYLSLCWVEHGFVCV
jgi:hypothetical protein